MAAGVGGDRPYTPKEPDPDELDVESLFNYWRNMQRRHKHLRGVRLELSPRESETGESAHYFPSLEYSDPRADPHPQKAPAIRMFLPTLRETQKYTSPYLRPRGTPYRKRTGFTEMAMQILKHEAAHAEQFAQEEISGRPDEPVTEKEAAKSGLTPVSPEMGWPASVHMKLFQLINRALGGGEKRFEQIGLPHEIIRARWQQGLRKTGPGAKMNLPVWGGKG